MHRYAILISVSRKISTIIWLGVAIILVTFFGIPSAWKTAIFAVLGIMVVIVGISLRRTSVVEGEQDISKPSKPYSDNGEDHKEEEQKRLDVKTESVNLS